MTAALKEFTALEIVQEVSTRGRDIPRLFQRDFFVTGLANFFED
jgi:hypothetical protein